MSQPPDPYRLLGLAPGAPLDEVKRAYRRLAKEAHPDAAGAAATARFIELQGAYESIVRGRARPVPSGRSRPGPAPRPAPPGPRPAGRPAPGARPGAKRRPAGAESAGPRRGPAGERPGTGAADQPRAGLGTTSYDGAEAEDPGAWAGASWYGPNMGTYWTVNPKEYADPRKHGPEYLARGRRRPRAPGRTEAWTTADAAAAAPGRAGAADPGAARPAGASSDPAAARARPEPPPARPEGADGSARTSADGSSDGDRPVASPASAGRPGRLLAALLGWPPIGLALAGLVGWATGCSRYAATCPAPLDLAPAAVHVAVLALLLAVPRLAAIAGVGTLSLAAAMVPAALLLSAAGGYERPAAATAALVALLGAGWLAGVLLAASGRVGLPFASPAAGSRAEAGPLDGRVGGGAAR